MLHVNRTPSKVQTSKSRKEIFINFSSTEPSLQSTESILCLEEHKNLHLAQGKVSFVEWTEALMMQCCTEERVPVLVKPS